MHPWIFFRVFGINNRSDRVGKLGLKSDCEGNWGFKAQPTPMASSAITASKGNTETSR